MDLKRSKMVLSRRNALRLVSAAATLSAVPQLAYADSKSDLKKTEAELAAAEEQLAEAEAQLEAIAAEYEELSIAQSKTLDQLDAVEKQIKRLTKRIAKLEAQLKAKQDELATLISDEYKDGSHGVVDLVVGASSVEEVISNLYYYDKVTQDKADLIQEVKDARADLEAEKAELKTQQAELEEVSKQQSEQLAAMQDKQYEAQLVIDGLDAEVRKLVEKRDAELIAAQKEAERARQEREAAAAAAAAAAQQEQPPRAGQNEVTVTPAPFEPYIAVVTSPNGKSVNVHRGPGMGYANAMDRLPVGTQVVVTEVKNKTWSKIEVNGQSGYIMSKYLTK